MSRFEPIHPAKSAALKRMTPEQKLQEICDLWDFARELLAAQVRAKNPGWDQAAIEQEVTR